MTRPASLPGLPPERQLELVAEFRSGNFANSNFFVDSYKRLATHIAVIEARRSWASTPDWEDAKSEGLLALSAIPLELSQGRPMSSSLKNYVGTRVRTRCREFLRSNRLVNTPWSSKRKGAKILDRKVFYEPKGGDEDVMYFYSDPVLAILYTLEDEYKDRRILHKEILSKTKTELERVIIKYVLLSYNDADIARKLTMSETKVRRVRHAFIDRLKKDADFSPIR